MQLRTSVLLLSAALLGACGAAAAPESARSTGAPPLIAPRGGGSWQPPIPALLGARERLELTSAQVASLDSLSRAWASRNDALSRAARDSLGDERPPSGAAMERARPAFEAVAENHRRTAEAVAGVLDERQRAEVCRMEEEQRAALRGPPRGGWPWCVAAPR